jgi:hypothetical protein
VRAFRWRRVCGTPHRHETQATTLCPFVPSGPNFTLALDFFTALGFREDLARGHTFGQHMVVAPWLPRSLPGALDACGHAISGRSVSAPATLLIEDLSDTARWVAFHRALESYAERGGKSKCHRNAAGSFTVVGNPGPAFTCRATWVSGKGTASLEVMGHEYGESSFRNVSERGPGGGV